VNPSWETLTGYSYEEASKMHIREIIHPDVHHLSRDPGNSHSGAIRLPSYEVKLLSKANEIKWVDYVSTIIKYEGRPALLGSYFDITIRKATENALREKEEELKEQARHLVEMNTALKILLEYREEEKKKMEKQIISNVKKLIFPYIDEMEKMKLNGELKTYLSIIRANLKDFISPFAYILSSQHLSLTPTEIQIANLIKQGQSSKEIAQLMNVSADAVTFHRANIRRKLEISGKKINLCTYLQSIDP
jgi:PAS domain S-box-containing protein